jgi:hypothetical protein
VPPLGDEFPPALDRAIVEALLYAALVTMVVSRTLQAALRKKPDRARLG